MSFSKKILNWYKNNHRKLPWRKTKNPYYILVSELMLQQTRVDQVVKYYLNFIKKFPSLKCLAQSKEKDVLKAWEGLGYYFRAQRLLDFAKKIFKKKIKFPNQYEKIIKYNGIGSYIGSAVTSICFNEKIPAIDGNAYRFYSRYFGLSKSRNYLQSYKFKKFIINRMGSVNPGDFNQAIMDIGSLLCTPKKYKCSLCPVHKNCYSLINKSIQKFPPLKRFFKKNKTYKFIYYFFLSDQKKIILHKRYNKNVWKNLYDFPFIESDQDLNNYELNNQIYMKYNNKIFIDHKNSFKTQCLINSKILIIQFFICNLIKINNFNVENHFIIFFENIKNYPFPKHILFFLKKINILI